MIRRKESQEVFENMGRPVKVKAAKKTVFVVETSYVDGWASGAYDRFDSEADAAAYIANQTDGLARRIKTATEKPAKKIRNVYGD